MNELRTVGAGPLPWWSRALLIDEARITARLGELRRSGRYSKVPNAFQISLGLLRMWHRLLRRSETVGTSTRAVRPTLRARLLALRAFRLPLLFAERAIAPLDNSGLLSSRERTLRHLLGAHHDRMQFAYDLEILMGDDEALADLERRAQAVVSGEDPRSAYLRDLVVFEGYHEDLLSAARAARRGELGLSAQEACDPDISFGAYLGWCARQPATAQEFYASLRAGEYDLMLGREAVSA